MPGGFQESYIEQVKEANDIVDVIGEYVQLKRAGANYKGVCPFHNEKTPSFIVSPVKQIYHCFGCSAGGDVISFISEYKNIEFGEAIEYLAERVGMEIERSNSFSSEVIDKRKILYEINRESALYYHNVLKKNQIALKYIEKRAISKSAVIAYGIGYSLKKWDGLYKYLKEKGYKEPEMLKLGLIVYNEKHNSYYDRFRGRLMFPILDIKQRVIGFGGRVIDNADNPKYLNSSDSEIFNKGYNLFSLNILRKKTRDRKLILAEGYMDVIALFQNGIHYAVASLGTALTQEQVNLIKKNADDIYICYDTDNAGLLATKRALDICMESNVRPKVIVLKGAKDPDEYILKYGELAFKNAIELALNPIEFYDYSLQNKYNLDNQEDKLNYIENLFEILSNQKNKTEVDLYLNKISKKLNVDSMVFKEDFYRRYRDNKTIKEKVIANKTQLMKSNRVINSNSYGKPRTVLKNQIGNLPYGLLYGAICSEKYYKMLIENSEIIELFDDELAELYNEIVDVYKSESIKFDLETLKEKIEILAKEKNISINQYNDVDSMHQTIIKLKKYRLNKKKSELKELIKITSDDEQKIKYTIELNELFKEYIEIDKYLKLK